MKPCAFCLGLLLMWLGISCSGASNKDVETVQSPGVISNEIRLGSSLALSGHASFLGTQTLHGALCYLRSINEAGGIHERKINVISSDDSYDPPL